MMPSTALTAPMEEVNILLNRQITLQKVKRMAFEILENNFDQKEIVIAGIVGEGFTLAALLGENLKAITDKKIWIANLDFDKKSKIQPEITIVSDIDTFKNKCVVLVDDVLNTGKTIAFAMRPFLSIPLKSLQVAVLVDRDHLQYPISAQYVGYSLSTTLKEHVKVVLSDEKESGVYLY